MVVLGFDGTKDGPVVGAVLYNWPSQGLELMMQIPEHQPSTPFVVDELGVHELIKPEALAFLKGPHYNA